MSGYMTDRQLALAGIEKVSMIKYYSLPGDVMGLMMICGRNEMINLAACDPGFEALEREALTAFQSHPETAADSFTRDILQSRSERILPHCLAGFEGVSGSILPLVQYEKYFPLAMENFIFFFLNELYSGIGSKAVFRENIIGYRRRCAVKFVLDDREKVIPFEVIRSAAGAVFRFSNVLAPEHNAEISFDCEMSAVRVNATSKLSGEIRREYTYDFSEGISRLRIFDRGELVCGKKEALQRLTGHDYTGGNTENITGIFPEKPSPEKLSALVGGVCCADMADYAVCHLPWGGMFLEKSSETSRDTVLAEVSGDAAVIRCFYRQYAPFGDGRIVIDSVNSVHEVFPLRDGRTVQTFFIPTGEFSRGIYRENFEGRYFSKTLKSQTVEKAPAS